MKVEMIKVAGGAMLPANEEAEALLLKLPNGNYTNDVKLNHNYKLLQKIHVFFKFCAQHYYGDENVDTLQIKLTRDEITIAAGYYEQVFLPTGYLFPDGKAFKVIPKSISYAKMTPDERGECYNKLVNAALKNVFHSADENTFNQLMSFF